MPDGILTLEKFNETRRARFIEHLKDGLGLARSARAVGVSPTLVTQYRKRHPEYEEQVTLALMDGVDLNTIKVVDALLQTALKGNVSAIQMWLYNRAPHEWRDRRSVQITGLEDVLQLLPAELARKLRKELARVVLTGGNQSSSTEGTEGTSEGEKPDRLDNLPPGPSKNGH